MEAYRLGFLSIQAQDFIEETPSVISRRQPVTFLSIQAQDFIEEMKRMAPVCPACRFLSIQAQDFIEERQCSYHWPTRAHS